MPNSKLFSVSVEKRKETIDELVEVSLLTSEYFLLLILSTVIVVSGLLINSASVIIGGMVVAPLLSPILTMAMGIVLADFKLMRKAMITLAVSAVVVVLFAVLLTLFYPARGMNTEIAERSSASLAHLIIAISAGILAAFALAKKNIPQTITGIAVSVALMPPIAATGVGIALTDWGLTSGSLTLFLVNFIGIVIAATVVFSLMGFYPVRRQAETKLKEEEKKAVQERKARELEREKEEQEQQKLEKEVEKELKKKGPEEPTDDEE